MALKINARSWARSSYDYPELNATHFTGMLGFDSQDIRDAVVVEIGSKAKRGSMASIAVIAKFGPTRGTNYY
jgi:hypothetical protein